MTHPPPHPADDVDPPIRGPRNVPRGAPAEPPPHDWPDYYNAIDGAPRETLLKALELFEREPPPPATSSGGPTPPHRAIDLACGEGRDTAELIRRGWQVTAIDSHPEAVRRVLARPGLAGHPNLSVAEAALEEVRIPPVDLVVASFALPFCPPEHFEGLWGRIVAGLRPGGRFCGQFFGDRDTWASLPGRTHHTREEVQRLLAPFAVEHFEEAERDGADALGVPKHWHVFHVVAQKRAG